MVGDDDIAGKQLRHAGAVEIDVEFFQQDRDRQILDQHAIGLGNDGRVARRAFRDHGVAAESRVRQAQTVLGGNVGDHAAAGKWRLAKKPLLYADRHFRVEQAAHADDDDGAVGKDIAPFIGRAALGRHQGGVVLLDHLGRIAAVFQAHHHLLRQHGARQRRLPFHLVMEIAQRLLAHIVAPAAHILEHLRRIAHDAQRGRGDEETHDHQEPPGRIHGIQAQLVEDGEPERTELVHIIGHGLVLLEHGADDGGDGDQGQQTDGKAHRRDQLDEFSQAAALGL